MSRRQKQEDPFFKVVFLIFSFILSLRLIGSFFPEARLWGINHASYIEGLFFIYIPLFIIGYFIYQKGLKKPVFISTGQNEIKSPFKTIYPYLIILLSVFGFYIFSTQSNFLGDGYQLISKLSTPHLTFKAESYGDMKAHRMLAEFLGTGDRFDVYYSFKYLSIFSGLVFVLSLLFYARKICSTSFGYYSFVIIGLLSSFTILFFGYVETYSLVSAFLFLFFLSATASIKNKKRSIVPIIAYALAFFFHQIAAVYSPILIIYIIWILSGAGIKSLIENKLKPLLLIFVAIPILIYIGIVVAGPLKLSLIFLPPFGNRFTTDGYFLLSINHLLDFINFLFFMTPIGIFVIVLKKRINADHGFVNLFLLCGALIGLLAAFLIEPKLGMTRDWDLFSTMMIGPFIAGLYFWFAGLKKHRQFQPATLLLIILSLSIFIPWLALNYSRTGLYAYALRAMERDPKHGRTGVFPLIPMLEKQGRQADVNRLKRYCVATYPERDLHKKGMAYLTRNVDYRKAEFYFNKTIVENPSFFMPYQSLARIQVSTNRHDEALENLKIADALNPYNSDNAYYTGMIYRHRDDREKAIKYLNQSIDYDALNPLPYMALSKYYIDLDEYDSSRACFAALPDTISIYPETANYELGLIGLELGDTTQALFYLEKYLSVGKDSTIINKIEQLKSQI